MFEWLDERIENLKREGLDYSRSEAHKIKLQKMLEELPRELKIEIDILSERYNQLRKSLERANADSEVSWSPPLMSVWSKLDPKALFRFKINEAYVYLSLVGNAVEIYTDMDEFMAVIPKDINRVSIAFLGKSEDDG